ncbi:MAG: glycosyltransferase family 4 protein [Candidatus Omnitrophica bacterium]|nr:glycosyltransferase family 4 protein [Candidatus Omnitrophota bacterium]
MKIAWDGRALVGPRTGIGWYTHHLIQAFEHIEEDWVADLLVNKPTDDRFDARVREVVLKFPNTVHLRTVWEKGYLPNWLRHNSPDVWHSPMTLIPKSGDFAKVATVHDIAFILYPEVQPASYRRYWIQKHREACQFADRIVCVSESTRRDLLKHFEVDSKRVVVVHEASDPSFPTRKGAESHAKTLSKLGLSEDFLLFVGTLEPRKNLPFLLSVYETAKSEGIDLPPLAVVGGKGWLQSGLSDRIQQLGDQIRMLGYLGRIELEALYHSAQLVLVPSVYEGFGLQAAEAQACGAVVIAADVSSLPEVVGEGGVLLPIESPKVWVDKIRELLDNGEVLKELSDRAKTQAARFSWELAARETHRVFQDAIEDRKG